MRWILGILLLGAMTGPRTIAAQQAQGPDFGPMEFLVGKCWVGSFPGGKMTDEHCFEWVFDRKFIRDRHVVRGGEQLYQGETIYGWDSLARKLSYWYWSSDGLTIFGRVEYTTSGISFPSRYGTPKGEVELQVVWTWEGTDGYHVVQSQKVGSEWKPVMEMSLTRKP